MKYKQSDIDYMDRKINKLFFSYPEKNKIEAYLKRCKQLRDSYNYRPYLAREQAFNEEIL
jgi:hypothetical protein